ncbi:MAG: RecBCD enzyme subunit RecC [Paracidovorax wautersii]|uniref:RecBCD enzyme subunit RecC n=1 Tax=Paracidovorax wautersii TaxID=1177982 RepID=A0A7V8FMD4_9BURK|nr:MAG: RecBCD enzyme subunit RecC [Paracidovorax wautersii]
MNSTALTPGLMVIHGNQPETLRELLVGWMRRYPLAPLETETVLVQSNGIAQWLKLALARDVADGGLGVAASLQLVLPAQFLWQAYRGVLGAEQVPELAALDKAALTWRLMRLLPTRVGQDDFQPLRRFLADDRDGRRLHQLAEKLADLFDQYQVYRADWLADWAAGRDQLQRAQGGTQPLADGQRWQAALWRALLADVGEAGMAGSRAGVHQRFLQAMAGEAPTAGSLPRRVIIFGISSMPGQSFEALAAMARHCQVLLCVHNPCRYHWADIVADKDLLRHEFKRHARKPAARALRQGEAQDFHQHAQPLLAAWGKQGRDYINLLDQHDEPARYRERIEPLTGGRIDLFDEPATGTLLGQLQSDILDLRPLAETRQAWPPVDVAHDVSVRFHVAHSPQREVEILHDQLLARLQADPQLAPRDIIVMVPDIDAYAPHVEAVFGLLERRDARFIPYTLADRHRRGHEPMLVALESLLQLPESRLTTSEILDLLDVGAVRRRLGLGEEALPLLRRWIVGAGVRWGLDGGQRQQLALPAAEGANSWRFGLRRMLLGFAVGEGSGQGEPFGGIEPYAEIGGLDAAALGPLALLLDRIEWASRELAAPATPKQWVARLRALVDLFFDPGTDAETLLRQQLLQLLDPWLAHCEAAGLDTELPLAVVRETWLAAIDQGGLNQRFMAGAVSFCTLLPMRAIPFKLVCLLGMNDGDYPRQQPRADFDLMQHDYRPGDRSRREGDRYLMLEALLSAREQLYVSWVGRSIRDNSERAPSVLVGQLRDHLAAGWRLVDGQGADGGEHLLAALTTVHPLQPFSPAYFREAPAQPGLPALDGLYTYAREWRQGHDGVAPPPGSQPLPPKDQEAPLRLRELAEFLVNPVQAFFVRRLQVHLSREEAVQADDEVFALDGLQAWQVGNDVCERLRVWAVQQPPQAETATAVRDEVGREVQRLRREGKLPLAGFGELAMQALQDELTALLQRYVEQWRQWTGPAVEQIAVRHTQGDADGQPLVLEDELNDVHTSRTQPDGLVRVQLLSSRLHEGKTYKWHTLVRHWVMHLALQLTGQPGTTVLVSPSGDLVLRPLALDEARGFADDLLDAWRQGMREPLPVAPRAAFAWLGAEGDEARARRDAERAYDGDFGSTGESQRSPALARAYPGFADLLATPQAFAHWAERLYGPIRACVRGQAQADAAEGEAP